MINLYQKLGLMPDATEEQIKRAMQQAAEQNRITLDELNKCKIFLLNAENREKYTQKLIEAHPELVDSLLDKMAEPMPQAKVNKKPDTKPSNGKVVVKKKEKEPQKPVDIEKMEKTLGFAVISVLMLIVGFVFYACSSLLGKKDNGFPAEGIPTCVELIKKNLNYPETFSFVSDERNNRGHLSDDLTTQTIVFTSNNGFNVPSRYVAVCHHSKKSNIVSLESLEESQ